jgi:hypothetical protein
MMIAPQMMALSQQNAPVDGTPRRRGTAIYSQVMMNGLQ